MQVLDQRFHLDASSATELATRFGTPLYVVNEDHFRSRIQSYLKAARASTNRAEIGFATKSNSTLALVKIAYDEGCAIDVASEGELRGAILAGVEPSACHLHGNNKQPSELSFAISVGIGHIVADHFSELEIIAGILSREPHKATKIVLRLAPGVDPVTHAKISTGQSDTKFGFNISDGSAEKATLRCLALGLDLIGFHCHVGSQLLDPEAQLTGGSLIAKFAADMASRHGFVARYLNVGGGLGVRYTASDSPMNIESYCRAISEGVSLALEGSDLEDVVIGHEPGRSLVGESGVTLYRVGVIKTVPASPGVEKTYISVDGGLADNPRPALYGAKYTVLSMHTSPRSDCKRFTVSGRHCETDLLFEDVDLPADLKEGDLLQVLCTGAYNSSMASNYNRYPRPATVLVRKNGGYDLIQKSESWVEMFEREIVPEDLKS